MWVFALFMRVFFFVNMSFTKNNEREKKKKNLNYIIKVFPLFICLTLLFFFSQFFFYLSHELTSRYVLLSPPVLLTNGHIYYFLITALRDAQFSCENSAIFHVGGEEGTLLCVCSTARFFDTATHRKDWKEEQVESALSIHCFFKQKKMCGSRFSHADYESLSENVFSDSTPFFFACCSALFFYCSAICLATPAAFFLCFFGFLLFVLVLYLFTWLLSLIVEGAVFNDFFLSLLSFAT